MNNDRLVEQDSSAPLSMPLPTDIAAVRTAATELEAQARVLIRERPVAAVLTAVGLGYLVARLVSRGPR